MTARKLSAGSRSCSRLSTQTTAYQVWTVRVQVD
jgi:hypothetical protein